MGQSESRSLARIAKDDLQWGKHDRRGASEGGREQIQVIGKRDLGDGDGAHGPVDDRLGRPGPSKRRGVPIASTSRPPLNTISPELKQTVIDLPDHDKLDWACSQRATVPLQGPHCCCHLGQLQDGILEQHGSIADSSVRSPLEVSPLSSSNKGQAKRRQTKESWILEELNFIAGRSTRQAAGDRKTVVRMARGVRIGRNEQPDGCDNGNDLAQQTNSSRKFHSKRLAKLDVSRCADSSKQTGSPDYINSGHQESHSIRHSHRRRDLVIISAGGGIKTRASKNTGAARESEQPQRQLAPVDILLATTAKEGNSATDESDTLTTQARPVAAPAATDTEVSTCTCECIGTTDAGGSAVDATNPDDVADNAIVTEPAIGSSNACNGNAIAVAAAVNVDETATCAPATGEISSSSGSAVSESKQMSGACQATGEVRASSAIDDELKREKAAKCELVVSCNSEQQNEVAAGKEDSPKESAPSADRREEEKEEVERKHQQVVDEKSPKRAHVLEGSDYERTTTATTPCTTRRLTWSELTTRYGRRMTRKGQMLVPPEMAGPGDATPPAGPAARSRTSRLKDSCFCHIVCALLTTIFPICGAFKDYSLPGDLFADLAAGFTVAILHIPQGMAYGLLSGVEPIHGLYVSFIPVLVMSFMSKSRHASYGTFAIISMLLVNTIQQVRSALREEQSRMFGAAAVAATGLHTNSTGPALVITDNHRPAPHGLAQHAQQDLLLRNVIGQSASQMNELDAQNYLIDRTNLIVAGGDGVEQVAAVAAAPTLAYLYPSNIEILSCVCIVCGIVHITMSLMRLGVLSLMFSDQLISSFTTAGAVHVLTSQLAGLFDLSLAPIQSELFKCMRIWWQFTQALVYDGFNQTTGLLSLASIAFLLLVKELIEPRLRARFKRLTCLPSELILMAIVISCSSYFKFESNYQVKIVGQVPSGLPEPKVPRLELVPYVMKDAISIALITFAMNLSIAQVYAKKFRYELNANQELFALGSANIISSFFSCFPCASSLSRSSIQSNLNVKSQLCSLFSCCIVVTIICYFAHILYDLPKSTLSCIIVVALKGILMQLRDLYDNWRLSKLDALVWILTFLSVLIFGVTYGLILGIIASIFMIFLRLLTPQHSILARLPGTDIFVDKDAFADCEEIEHVKIFRFNSALCYLNRTRLKSMIEKLLPGVFPPTGFRAICAQLHSPSRAHPFYESTNTTAHADESSPPRVSHLIIDCSALSYCDYSGATTLVELVEDLEARKVAVYLAACPMKLIDMLEKIQGQKEIVSRNVYPTISDALGQISYLQRVVVMPTMATYQEKRNGKGGGSSLTGSSMSRGSDANRQPTPAVGGGRGGPTEELQQQADKRPSILFAPNKGG